MGKGLSELQRDILAALEQWPSHEEATATRPGYIGDWALPRDIIAALALPTSAATSAAISRALARLHARGLVARAFGERASAGKAFRYVRITDPANGKSGTAVSDHRRANQTKAGINGLYIIMGQVHALVEMIVPSNEDGDIKMTPAILDQITAIQDAACDALDLPHILTIPLPQKSPPEEQS